MAALHEEGCYEKKRLRKCFYLQRTIYRTMTSGRKGAPYFRRYGWELVSKPTISSKKSWGGATVEPLHEIWKKNTHTIAGVPKIIGRVFLQVEDRESPQKKIVGPTSAIPLLLLPCTTHRECASSRVTRCRLASFRGVVVRTQATVGVRQIFYDISERS